MKLLISIILLAFLPGVAVAMWGLCLVLVEQSAVLVTVLGGFALGLVVDQILLRRIPGFETFEHELTHALAALLCFRRVTGFRVTARRGGWVQHSGGFGGEIADDFISFAPYVLPTFTLASVLVRPLVPGVWFPWYDVWIGATLGFHTWSTIRETARSWSRSGFRSAGDGEVVLSDTARRGFAYSAVYIATVTIALHGLVLAILLHGYGGIGLWARQVWSATVHTAHYVVAAVSSFR